MDFDELKTNLYSVQSRIARAAASAGRSVSLVAATKTVPPSVVTAAISLGIKSVGENRVQEFNEKRDKITGADWHFIGTLQRNKAKYLVGNVALIQSVSNAPLATEIDRLAEKLGTVQDVLIEVNIGGEPSKTGASVDTAEDLIATAQELENVRVRGIMAIPPRGAHDDVYAALYRLFEKHADETFDTLSVGMSGDFERAIAFGSNMVRIGTAIFGTRNSTR